MDKSVYIVVNIAVDVKEARDGETAKLLARLRSRRSAIWRP